uniref:Uncharacterized protein n=1 Tax=Arundo donax TaxID=35708 RepID=A0A0A9APH3_ARUDO
MASMPLRAAAAARRQRRAGGGWLAEAFRCAVESSLPSHPSQIAHTQVSTEIVNCRENHPTVEELEKQKRSGDTGLCFSCGAL